ncbi:MAG: mevalonate kinase [Caldilinea sp.]|nr:mevalonate kinase [Caldilinea sp.]MCB9113515.1 mevalonate kinase [Caldilineaceae bacterium]MCB9118992.1 mevalonate kinase [Caldilineaceae bacterium]MCB9126084.1 mevalonate kinase [Caldilineaceae bacterium]MCO5213852.1 mevalonate kinase [Caldilinea sp.]
MFLATAPGKVILVGEHAVVYGRPAIAAPVWQTVATATIAPAAPGSGCHIIAPDVGLALRLADAGDDEPLAVVTRLALARLGITRAPDWQITLHSDIPIASGMGSGAALSTALVRAVMLGAGHAAEPAEVSDLVYESERFYHGTPSGIDNTVVAYGMPIWFVKGQPPEPFVPAHPISLAIADSGIRSPTKETVGDVRRAWSEDPARYEDIFDEIGRTVLAARHALEAGDSLELGRVMDANQTLLERLDVSSPVLATLIGAARKAGALGAKLSGGGRGGNMIALVDDRVMRPVCDALAAAGARRVIVTQIGGTQD